MTRTDLSRKGGLLIDANLLILYVIGCYDPKRIQKERRTDKYIPEDFDLLLRFMGLFRHFVTTPNILTEVCNLLEGVTYQFGPVLSLLPELVKNFIEIHEPSQLIMAKRNKESIKFGLSDPVACSIVEQNYLLLTDDLRLCYYLQNRGFDALNFNNLRSDYLLH